MQVYAFQASGPAVLDNDIQKNNPSSGNRIAWNDGIPTTGYWRIGDIVKGIGANADSMFLCTVEGEGALAEFVTVTGV